jgi:HSP20 family protein
VPLLSWDPLRGVLVLTEPDDERPPASPGWSPPIDVFETADAFVLTAELAGMCVADVEVIVRDGRVTISGRRPERGVRPEQYHRIERGHGAFSRTFTFAQAVDVGAVRAESRDGVLTVTVPKTRKPEPRRVVVE